MGRVGCQGINVSIWLRRRPHGLRPFVLAVVPMAAVIVYRFDTRS